MFLFLVSMNVLLCLFFVNMPFSSFSSVSSFDCEGNGVAYVLRTWFSLCTVLHAIDQSHLSCFKFTLWRL